MLLLLLTPITLAVIVINEIKNKLINNKTRGKDKTINKNLSINNYNTKGYHRDIFVQWKPIDGTANNLKTSLLILKYLQVLKQLGHFVIVTARAFYLGFHYPLHFR